MTTLYLAGQNRRNRNWFPVGRLIRHDDPIEYEFEYLSGAYKANDTLFPSVVPVPGFPDLHKTYRHSELFPIFRYRVMDKGRPDRAQYLKMLGLGESNADVLAELAVSGGHTIGDRFEIFPAIEPDQGGRFETRFILHGLTYTNHHSIKRAGSLEPRESLEIVFELNNPVTVHGLGVKTADHYFIGWLPRYLVDVFHSDHAWQVEDVRATVAQVNGEAPISHRVLVDLSGQLPPGVDPMAELDQYQPISSN